MLTAHERTVVSYIVTYKSVFFDVCCLEKESRSQCFFNLVK